jgi:hypothetical protein
LSKEAGQANWINYTIIGLAVITLILSIYSTTLSSTIMLEISLPEDALKKSDLEEVVSKDDLSELATKDEISNIAVNSDLDSIRSKIEEILETMGELKPTPEPTPHPWTMMIRSAHLWENGRSEYIADQSAPLTLFLNDTLHRLNTYVVNYGEEKVEELKEGIKAVYLRFRFYESVSVVSDVKYAYFIIEDDVGEDLEGHVLVYSVMPEEWSCWAITKEGSDEVDTSWINKLSFIMGEKGFVEGTVWFIGAPCPPGTMAQVPPCDGPYPNYEIKVYQGEGTTMVTSVTSSEDGYYKILLDPGSYVIYTQNGLYKDNVKTNIVLVQSGNTTKLNLIIDTGIR